jgi:peptidoglycan hydrolase-like protein with peptidoglycan-binding domain
MPERTVPSQADRTELARSVQRELKRVGCNPGDADGKWGPKAQAALKRFATLARLALHTDEPTEAAREALSTQQSRVCPLDCAGGEIMDANGRCIARSPAPSQDAGRSAAGTAAPVRAAPSAVPAAPSAGSGGGLCRDGNMELCRIRCAQGEARACGRLQRGR